MKKRYILAAAAIISSSIFIFSSNDKRGDMTYAANTAKTDPESINWTIKFLKEQAGRNVSEMEQEIDKVNKDSSIQKFDMSKAKSRFGDVVFLGDSITEYLKNANILDESSVLAVKGEHVNQAKKHMNVIKNLKPKEIVILYGANDITAYSPERYKQEYISLIKEIKKVDPGVKIYVQAPLPVNESVASAKDSRINNENVKNLAQKAKEACRETGATYLSSDDLVTGNDLYEPDGIHFKYGFYKNWLYFLSQNI